MAALRTLGELGQDYPDRRQTLANEICGYLRLPSADDRSETQVREVAQDVLRDHLRPYRSKDGTPQNNNFWPNTEINLQGAHLVDANFAYCEFGRANFDETNFEGTTWFRGSTFASEARFVGSIFDGWLVSFEDAVFEHYAWHRWTAFNACAEFQGARFKFNAEFSRARFSQGVDFSRISVDNVGWFTHNVFDGTTLFRDAKFSSAQFIQVLFRGPVDFRGTKFVNGADRQEVFITDDPEIAEACHWPSGWLSHKEPSSSSDEN